MRETIADRRTEHMAHKLLWVIAVVMATMALVAGCMNINVPKGPYAVVGTGSNPPTPEDINRVRTMDRGALEAEDLRLAGDNESLRSLVERQKRDIKELKSERDQLKDRIDRLESDIKDLRKGNSR